MGWWDGIMPTLYLQSWSVMPLGVKGSKEPTTPPLRPSLQKKPVYRDFSKPHDRIVGTLSCHTVASDGLYGYRDVDFDFHTIGL